MRATRRYAFRLGLAVLAVTSFCHGRSSAQMLDDPRQKVLNPLAAFEPAKLQGFLKRPLFSFSRRSPPVPLRNAPPSATPASPSPPPALRLVGIVRTPKESIAQVVRGADTQRLSLRLGDFIDDWAVASIDASTIMLKRGEQKATFSIFPTKSPEGVSKVTNSEVPPSGRKRQTPEWTKEQLEGFFGK